MKRSTLVAALRFVFSVGLAVLLFRLATARLEGTLLERLRAAEPSWLLAGFVLYGLGIGLACWRWGRLLAVVRIPVPGGLLMRLGLIGVAFSFALPGSVSGDVVKVGYLSGLAPGREVEATLATLVDRLMGMMGLFVVTLFALAAMPLDLLLASPVLQAGVGFVGLMATCGIVALALLFFHQALAGTRLGQAAARVAHGRLPAGVLRALARLASGMDLYRQHPRLAALALGTSVGVHSLVGLSVFSLSQAVSPGVLGFRACFLGTQVANTLAAVPLTPGGVGGRDLVLARFLEMASAPPAAAALIPALLTLVILAWSAVGGLVFLLQPVPSAAPQSGDPAWTGLRRT